MSYTRNKDEETSSTREERTREDVHRCRLEFAKRLLVEAGFADRVAILSTRDTAFAVQVSREIMTPPSPTDGSIQ